MIRSRSVFSISVHKWSLAGFVLGILLFLSACNNKPEKESPAYFPVISFLNDQVRYVDSLQLPVQKLTTVNNQTDTVLIDIAEFKRLANEFTTPDINDPALQKDYTENSFADQTINSVTLTYSAKKRELPLQRLDVIIHPDPVLDDRVQSIYMEKGEQVKDTTILKKLYWKANQNFQIITIRQSGLVAVSSVIKVVWNGGY